MFSTDKITVSDKTKEIDDHIADPDISVSLMAKEETRPKMSTARIWKNLFVVSLGFLFLFTATMSLENLQSSINKDKSLGTNALATVYGALVVSCLFLPPVIIARLGCKWTIAFSMLTYMLYMVANYYPRYATIIPATIIQGLGAGPLWSAKCAYVTELGVSYAKQKEQMEHDVINRFFGVFFMVFQTGQIWGNLISSMVFKTTDNTTISEEDLLTCGANFCPSNIEGNNTNLDRPSDEKVLTLCGIYIGLGLLAFIIIAFGLDPITLDRDEENTQNARRFSMKLVFESLKHFWRSHYQKLLVPLTMYSGIEQAFIAGEYSRSFIACALGIENIGFVMICYAVCDSACSLTFGRLVQYVGHIPFFVLAFLLHGGLQVTFLFWQPDPDRVYMFYIFAALWGMGDAVIQTQINVGIVLWYGPTFFTSALYGFLWTKDSEAAFTNYRLWESIGYIIAFVSQGFLCTNVKLFMALGWLCVGMLGYAIVEVTYRRNKRVQTVAER